MCWVLVLSVSAFVRVDSYRCIFVAFPFGCIFTSSFTSCIHFLLIVDCQLERPTQEKQAKNKRKKGRKKLFKERKIKIKKGKAKVPIKKNVWKKEQREKSKQRKKRKKETRKRMLVGFSKVVDVQFFILFIA